MRCRPSANPPDAAHVRELLATSPLFGELPEALRDELASLLQWVFLPGGEVLIRPGDPTDALYIVLHGSLRVYYDLDGSGRFEADEAVDAVGQGEVVAEEGMLSEDPHDAMVLAVRDTELGRLEQQALWDLVDRSPALLRRLARSAVRRLRSAFRRPSAPRVVNLAIVPADREAPLPRFAAALASALGAFESLLHVTRSRFEDALGPGTADDDVDAWDETDRRVVSWICAQERGHRFILYEADQGYTAWTRRCIRSADRVLIVARAEADPNLTDGERLLYGGDDASEMVRKELVLLHEPETELPVQTRRWLDRRPEVDRVHHVKLSDPDHVARLARFLSGRAVGVVLGGGEARGAAQLGAVQALYDAGIPVDLVGGTSAGGGMAGLIAQGWDLERCRVANRRAFLEMAPFSQYALPFHSLMRKKGIEAPARFLYRDVRIEDLWIDFFCVSCDLLTGSMVVHRRGELWRAILATTALPGVCPPVLYEGKLLVDGGVMDNNPVAVMRRLNSGPIILVDVGHANASLVDDKLPDLPTNWESWLHTLDPFGSRIRLPNAVEVVVRTMTVSRPATALERMADLYVRPAVEGYGLVDFASADELIVIGYNAMMEALERHAEDEALLERLGLAKGALDALPRLEMPRKLPTRT